jgi:hypothetical protein
VIKAILQMLRAFSDDRKDHWDEFIGLLEFAYNSSVNTVTGKTPFFWNQGGEPVALNPIDLELLWESAT